MVLRKLGAVALVLALVGSFAGAQQAPFVRVPDDDPAVEAAIAQGRATLGRFWEALQRPRPGEDSFALKVALPTNSGGTEHIWAGAIVRTDGKIFGRIDNEPRDLKGIRFGQRIEIRSPRQ